MQNKKLLLIGAAILAAIGIVAFASQDKSKEVGEDIETASITSPFTDTTITPSLFYRGDLYPSHNERAARSQYIVFDSAHLGIQKEIVDALTYGAIPYLQKTQPKNTTDVYIHVDKSSITYSSADAYSFIFYVDSPEAWYRYTQSIDANEQQKTTIEPIPGKGI